MSKAQRQTRTKRRARLFKMGRARKNKLAQQSTLSYAELFAGFGEPGKPAEKAN